MKLLKITLLLLLTFLFTACNEPVADAGKDQNVNTGDLVTLDGSGSTDEDGDELTFVWGFVSKPSDSEAVITNPTAVKPKFVADADGRYVVQLTVNDGSSSDSDPDTVLITAVALNVPPIADAGDNQNVVVGTFVSLDGSNSSDKDGDTLTYMWTMSKKPAGSNAVLSDNTSKKPTFKVDVEGLYLPKLVVSDGEDNSTASSVSINVTKPTVINGTPVANAGSDQTVDINDTVKLDGSSSYDPEGDPLNYRWSFTKKPDTNSTAQLDDATKVDPSFKADMNGTYIIQLIVDDSKKTSTPDPVTIDVRDSNSTP